MKFTADDIKVTDCRAVVAYCDVTGFTAWMTRATVARSDVKSFIREMKFIFRQFRIETGYETIPIGDGIIALIAAGDDGAPPNVFHLIVATLRLQKRMLRLIKVTGYPRPGGFRIRITGGFVYRTDEPPIPGMLARVVDFLGACLNLGSRLLEYRRDLAAIITEEALAMMLQSDQRKLDLKRIEPMEAERTPRGVDPAEMVGLRQFALRPKS